MPIAHACLSCGTDLSRIRAPIDCHYQLPIVVCPACGQGAVRRRHPGLRFLRLSLRSQAAARRVVLQLLAAVSLGGLTMTGMLLGARVLLHPAHVSGPLEELIFFGLFWGACVPVAAGAWLTAGFRHCRPIRVWCGWACLLIVATAIGLGVNAFIVAGDRAWQTSYATELSLMLSDASLRLLCASGMLVAMLAVALAGIPLGMFILWIGKTWRSAQWRARRRRRRLRLQST